MENRHTLIFYDGHCGLCHRAVLLALRRDADGSRFRFAPLQGSTVTRGVVSLDEISVPDSIVVLAADLGGPRPAGATGPQRPLSGVALAAPCGPFSYPWPFILEETPMCRLLMISALLCLSTNLDSVAEAGSSADSYWPQWRGPLANGVAPHANPPVEWSEGKNVAWKTEIPGKGSASPIVWEDTVYVLTAVPAGKPVADATSPASQGGDQGPRGIQPIQAQQFTILAIRRSDGGIAWQKVLREAVPHEGTHATGTWASNSPVTDGEHIYAYFGSHGLYCLDMKGNLVWEKDLGDMQTRRAFGEGSSPALSGNTLLVNWDHEGASFVVALDKRTGEEIWRQARDEITSWSTPLIVEHDGRHQAIVSATGRVRSYDLEKGDIVWEAGGMTVNVIPTPVHVDGLVILTSGFRGNALLAVQLEGARGDITGTDSIVWSLDRDTPYTPSPLLYGDQLYFTKTNDGILSSYNARTGENYFGPVRLNEVPNIYASPVGAAGRVYIAGRDGVTLVIEHGTEFKVLAANELDDGFDASPAVAGKELYLRGKRYLYRISE